MLRSWNLRFLCTKSSILRSTFAPVSEFSTNSTPTNSTESHPNYGAAVTRLRLTVPPRELAFKSGEGVGGGKEGRIMHLRRIVATLFDQERLELKWYEATEVRLYAERLIQEAIKASSEQDMIKLVHIWLENDPNQSTEPIKMDTSALELAYFWLNDPYLVEKLFKVFVPRYRFYNRAYTSLFRTQSPPAGSAIHNPMEGSGILELHGNPWPPIQSNYGSGPKAEPFKQKYLINVLIRASRDEMNRISSQTSSF